MRIGWLSTGRDEAATNLLRDVLTRAESDHVPLEIAVVFCDREPGEAAASDRFLQFARSAGLVVETVSSAQSWRRWQTQAADLPAAASRQAWREQFHDEVMWHLRPYQPDLLVLAGYMLIVSPPMCERYAMLNLHPALPGGPTGTWQEVIWELLRTRARETGAMMHLVTPELDRGPAISYVRFAITGPAWDGLWKEYLEQEERRGGAGGRPPGGGHPQTLPPQNTRTGGPGHTPGGGGRGRAAGGRPPGGPPPPSIPKKGPRRGYAQQIGRQSPIRWPGIRPLATLAATGHRAAYHSAGRRAAETRGKCPRAESPAPHRGE